MKPKICVYAVCVNEIKFVERFVNHSKEADLILVCDTGSTDGTPEKLKELGVTVHNIKVVPWRFDTARNTALSLIPDYIDICVTVDLDECLQPGWRENLDAAWEASNGTATRFTYHYVWNWNADGTPGINFTADRWHARLGYIWKHPCHEMVYPTGQEIRWNTGAQLHQHADTTKDRSNYLNLLATGFTENPSCDRMHYYYARELHFVGQYENSNELLKQYLKKFPTAWDQEKAAACGYISKNYEFLENLPKAQQWAIKGILYCDHTREPWLKLARISYLCSDWFTCFWAITKCLNIQARNTNYIADNSAWGCEPYDLGAISAYNMGLWERAVELGKQAVDLNPDNSVLKTRLQHYMDKTQL